MEIYITDLMSKERLRFPMLPEKISIGTGAAFQSYNILTVGEVKFPVGENLTAFSWSGILPGETRRQSAAFSAGLMKEWRDPKEIQSLWSFYRANRRKLRLLITETPVNHDVYLDSYNVDYKGGYGDYEYKISFVHAKDLKILTESEIGQTASADKPAGVSRPESPVAETYTVKKGDTLWGIANRFLSAGRRYPEIHAINQPPLGSDPNKIYPGQVLTIPGR